MAAVLDDIEELALCSCCGRAFDDAERAPKLLACKHHFCLACTRGVLADGRDVRCAHCRERTEPPGGRAAALPTHAAVLALARRLAPAPDSRALLADLRRLAARRRAFLLRALDAATALKVRLETELAAPAPSPADADRSPAALRALHADALLQARLDDLVRDADAPLDAETMRRALVAADAPPPAPGPGSLERGDPALFLANYCATQLYARRRRSESASTGGPPSPAPAPRRAPGGAFPRFYFELEVDGAAAGRVVVEVREDVAPRMARNFAALATGELGVGYRGCAVFQCWERESVITGDFELNNGRGGRSVFEEGYFMPDDTKLAAVRGAVGMRRSQRRRDHLGLVGSQFRIVLREMRGFSAIFASVVEGLKLVDRLSRAGDGAGKPHSAILIAACGRHE